MSLFTFKGGIHPYDGKGLSKDCAIRSVLPKGDLVFPLSQHIGAPAIAVVKKGDHVLRGQIIAQPGGFFSVPIHSSVSGTVRAIEKRFGPAGTQLDCIVIDNDEKYEEIDYGPEVDFHSLSQDEILERISRAGVVGMGGAGFPTKIKLQPKEPEKISYIIANCAECEPYITSDYRRMLENTDELLEGMRIVLSLFPNAEGIFAVEDNKKDCIDKLISESDKDERISVKKLQTKYPQGAERQLIYATTKRAIHSGMLPADAGCIVDNVETLIAICQAVRYNRPVIERVMTVSGENINTPSNFKVPLGIDHTQLVEEAGGFKHAPERLISGGPMMGFAMVRLDVPVTKTSSCLLSLAEGKADDEQETACINCGRCVEICPSRIIPSRLADHAQRLNEAAFTGMHGLECVECGSCSYVCPAKRPLKQAIGAMRKIALANRKKK